MAVRPKRRLTAAVLVSVLTLSSACAADDPSPRPSSEPLLETGVYALFGCSTFTTWFEDGSVYRETLGRESCHDASLSRLDAGNAEVLAKLIENYDSSGYDPSVALPCSDGDDTGYLGWTIYRSREPARIHLCDGQLDPDSELGALARELRTDATE